jgi:hypothetical protein
MQKARCGKSCAAGRISSVSRWAGSLGISCETSGKRSKMKLRRKWRKQYKSRGLS